MTPMTQTTTHAFELNRHGSECCCEQIRVRVQPFFLPQHSVPVDRRYVYAYRIEIVNESSSTVRLRRRRWHIVDALGRAEEVRGDGVVGVQPSLEPGESFEYASHCILRTAWGTMEGHYEFTRAHGAKPFEAPIARFYLVADEESSLETADDA